MGYLRKDSTIANPAKKSLTVFQNSYTASEQYVTGWYTRGSIQDGPSSWQMYRYYYGADGHQYKMELEAYYSSPPPYDPNTYYTYGTRTVTRWNTKWSKRSA